MKKSNKIIASLLVMVLVLMSPMSVYAMSQQNIIAQQALKKQLIADKRQYCKWGRNQIKYAYADVDGDNVLELITEPGYGYLTQAVYDYQNGTVRNVASVGQGYFTKYYPDRKIISIKNSGHMGVLCDYYLKYVNGRYKTVAYAEKDYGKRSYDENPVKITYYVHGQKATKAEYSAYIKKLIKNKTGKSFSKLKWKRY
ncbi:hypothetical protein DW022_01535 [Ruminococcus sp. AF37-6AT]|jgi:hypothetical protein|nr:hypothetical protein [Ruminococcus sp.]RHJ97505.1 hypothetical protein DW098_07785 [Ruminococcus sp. AM07-21]RHL51348.1 hypothetical protein DW022_01535 [Ruminococcus sp. AF37-6AT]RHP59432.1 hypothetical protein DWZ27_02990 [Ruminococcus sp. AF31-16BH]